MLIICPVCYKRAYVSALLPLGTELKCEHCGSTHSLHEIIQAMRKMSSAEMNGGGKING